MLSFIIATPTRGIVHSRMAEAVIEEIRLAAAVGHEFRGWIFTHDQPIPDCDEELVERALDIGADVIVFIEDDNIPTAGALIALLALLAEPGIGIAIEDYPVNGRDEHSAMIMNCASHAPNGNILWCGLGVTAIRSEVFDTIPRPWFGGQVHHQLVRIENELHERTLSGPPPKWGGQDVWFTYQVVKAGWKIAELPTKGSHARILALGDKYSNHGLHQIKIMTPADINHPV
jgi:hypothetical protein